MRKMILAVALAGYAASATLGAGSQCAVAPPPSLEAGALAPEFSLPGSDGRTYRLSDYRGRQAVVLTWFARAFSAG